MLSEDEKKALKLLEDIKNNSWTTKYIMSSDSKNADILLNLITKLQKENEEKDRYIKNKDKQIDLMAEYISKRDVEEDICMKNKTNPDWCNEDYTNCQGCIKKYFAGLVEKE